jgi:hypothetical protein
MQTHSLQSYYLNNNLKVIRGEPLEEEKKREEQNPKEGLAFDPYNSPSPYKDKQDPSSSDEKGSKDIVKNFLSVLDSPSKQQISQGFPNSS